MNRITEITRLDIRDLFTCGIEIESFLSTEKVKYYYNGRLEEIDFLKRLYNLKEMPSYDSRFLNAESDIRQHTLVNSDDYPDGWIFDDDRFQLSTVSDEIYLSFLCEIFHPAVRLERGYWKECLDRVNELLRNDGYELYVSQKISNRDVYGWRVYRKEEKVMFIPFSMRNEKEIKAKKIVLSIKRSLRDQIYQVINRNNFDYLKTDETGWKTNTSILEAVWEEIHQYYTPKHYNSNGKYIEAETLYDFIMYTTPYCVLDVVELFDKSGMNDEFEIQINSFLQLNDMPIKLEQGKIVWILDRQLQCDTLDPVQEIGLKQLLQDATKYYEEDNVQIAVEKIWDAFERLKTYYYPTLDKKSSANRIVENLSMGQEEFKELFEKEFAELTKIGNNFRIRHHEKNKTDIEDRRHYEYLYKRCLSLISVAIQYLK